MALLGDTYARSLSVLNNITASGNITGAKVYNAVWNDYAEWFKRADLDEIIEPGDIVTYTKDGGVTKTTKYADTMVVGVFSNTYGHIVGGENLPDMADNIKKYVPVGLNGRLPVKVIGKVSMGDLIVSSDIPGTGIAINRKEYVPGSVIGKALEDKEDEGLGKVEIMIMLN